MAFDSVPHKLFIKKLPSYGFDRNITMLLASLVSHRSHCVCFEDICSSILPITPGVPQCRNLGLLLFLLLMNDLPSVIQYFYDFLFADDLKVIAMLPNIETQMDIDSLLRWADDNGMKFNCTKAFSSIKFNAVFSVTPWRKPFHSCRSKIGYECPNIQRFRMERSLMQSEKVSKSFNASDVY